MFFQGQERPCLGKLLKQIVLVLVNIGYIDTHRNKDPMQNFHSIAIKHGSNDVSNVVITQSNSIIKCVKRFDCCLYNCYQKSSGTNEDCTKHLLSEHVHPARAGFDIVFARMESM